MITLENDSLIFRFPEVHEDATCTVGFQRTLRLPDDGYTYPLPAGLGNFPLRHTDDFAGRLPDKLTARGGVVMPMWQSEAMWINFGPSFHGSLRYPFAVKIATGKINAITGEAWRPGLHRDPQDYVVVPDQPWLDGYCVEKGTIRQFVAAPLGSGITAEEQITGKAEVGGLQIIVYPMKRKAYERLQDEWMSDGVPVTCKLAAPEMGLAPGGKMRQEIYKDQHAFDVWDLRHASRCFVALLDAVSWNEVTGEPPTTKPISAEDYRAERLPWFDYYAADQKALAGSGTLADLKSVGGGKELGLGDEEWSSSPVINLGKSHRPLSEPDQVREADW